MKTALTIVGLLSIAWWNSAYVLHRWWYVITLSRSQSSLMTLILTGNWRQNKEKNINKFLYHTKENLFFQFDTNNCKLEISIAISISPLQYCFSPCYWFKLREYWDNISKLTKVFISLYSNCFSQWNFSKTTYQLSQTKHKWVYFD